jgi:hypothetical protein
MRIINVRPLWASEGEAILAVQESRKLPQEEGFVRLVLIDGNGQAKSEAYLSSETFACDTRRPFTRLTNGKVVSLAFKGNRTLSLNVVSFLPIGTATPQALERHSDAILISEEEDSLSALEKLNGTPSASEIALSSITRNGILQRAHAALDMKWTLHAKNFSSTSVANQCDPLSQIWRRPSRLNAYLEKEVKGIPYRWGGFLDSLTTFQTHLTEGRLAGDDCTCRNGDCVYARATGLDCSGFVSYAWATGNYFTTASLPRPTISKAVSWDAIKPGDIVNKARSHVRLVESVFNSLYGPGVVVIESAANESCGGVCRRSYLKNDLRNNGYKPFRRLALDHSEE